MPSPRLLICSDFIPHCLTSFLKLHRRYISEELISIQASCSNFMPVSRLLFWLHTSWSDFKPRGLTSNLVVWLQTSWSGFILRGPTSNLTLHQRHILKNLSSFTLHAPSSRLVHTSCSDLMPRWSYLTPQTPPKVHLRRFRPHSRFMLQLHASCSDFMPLPLTSYLVVFAYLTPRTPPTGTSSKKNRPHSCFMLSSYLLLCLYTSWSTRISRRELHERYILKKKIHPHSCFMPSSYLLLCLHTSWSSITSRSRSGDVVHLVRASDRHAAGAGSIPRCGKGFFSQS